ncbi:MAG: Wzz/FepE/Etk N-terminal domain-containing protein [Thermodesulfobacteriota bacterium]
MEEDSIELIDYLRIIWKRKGLIIAGTLLCMVAAGVVSFTQPRVYRATSVIEIGTITLAGQVLPVEKPGDTKEKIESAFIQNVVEDLKFPEPFLPAIKVANPKGTRVLKIGVDSPSGSIEEAVKVLEELNAVIVNDHRKIIQSSKTALQNRIKALNLQSSTLKDEKKSLLQKHALQVQALKGEKDALTQKLSLLKKNREDIQEQIKVLGKRIEKLFSEKERLNLDANPDNTLSILVFSNEIQRYQRYYNELQEKLSYDLANQEVDMGVKLDSKNDALKTIEIDIKRKLANKDEKLKNIELTKQNIQERLDNFNETTVIKAPSYDEVAVPPKIKLNILLAGMAGVMFFLFLAFLLEYINRTREQSM